MKCPYCGGEAKETTCEYCGSDLRDIMPEFMREELNRKEDGDDEITADMIDEIRNLCHDFQKDYPDDFSSYDKDGNLIAGDGVKDKLFDVLDIPEDEEVFLIHDDTIRQTGKNGFAITEEGFYCLEEGEELEFTSFEDIEEDDETNFDETTVFLEEDETNLAYFTGDDDTLEDICDLCDDIIDVLFD